MKLSREEFEKLALAQLDAVDRMARALTGNRPDADDLVQETYLHAMKARDTFDLQAFGIRPWLLRILHNVHVTRHRREHGQPRAMEAEQLERADEAADAGAPPPPMELAEMDEEIDQALDQLPVELRAALILWAVDELSYKEIAAVLDVPIGTVMSRLHRARRRLYGLLHDFAKKRGMIRE